jgi:hypothetical protein
MFDSRCARSGERDRVQRQEAPPMIFRVWAAAALVAAAFAFTPVTLSAAPIAPLPAAAAGSLVEEGFFGRCRY